MPERPPYADLQRKLIIALDVGTTFSGSSYVLLDHGKEPKIQGVLRYPAQKHNGGSAKIPSILYYDKDGNMKAAGSEALQESFLDEADESGYVKVEWFKLHMRPKTMGQPELSLPKLPEGKTVLDVFADFLLYLYRCTKIYFIESEPSGEIIWESVQGHTEFILSHPNGWEGAQQALMRQAALKAGLVSAKDAGSHIKFVTEGEASLHFCISKGVMERTPKDGFIVLDAGGGTIDLGAYKASSTDSYEEIASAKCVLRGSVYVTRDAQQWLQKRLKNSKFGNPIDLQRMVDNFDQSSKLEFRGPDHYASVAVRFGGMRDKDPELDIVRGQIKIPSITVSGFFEPSISAAFDSIMQQCAEASVPITAVYLVGGFGASDWLFSQLQDKLKEKGISICRPDGHVNKAVPDGALTFYLDHSVSSRKARFTYGAECSISFDPNNEEHVRRKDTARIRPSGNISIPKAFDAILLKGTSVNEETEFRQSYFRETTSPSALRRITTDIISYRGRQDNPKWFDIDESMFTTLCTIQADTSKISASIKPQPGLLGQPFYRQHFDIVLLLGLIETKAQLAWVEEGVEKRSEALIVYDESTER